GRNRLVVVRADLLLDLVQACRLRALEGFVLPVPEAALAMQPSMMSCLSSMLWPISCSIVMLNALGLYALPSTTKGGSLYFSSYALNVSPVKSNILLCIVMTESPYSP